MRPIASNRAIEADLPLPRWCYSPWVTGPVGALLGHILAWLCRVDGFPRAHWWQIVNFWFYALMAAILSAPISRFLTRSGLMRGPWIRVVMWVAIGSLALAVVRAVAVVVSETMGSKERLQWLWIDLFNEGLRGFFILLGMMALLVYGLIRLPQDATNER